MGVHITSGSNVDALFGENQSEGFVYRVLNRKLQKGHNLLSSNEIGSS